MNLQNLLDNLFEATGFPDTGSNRVDGTFQKYKDYCNTIQDEIAATCSPSLHALIRETTLSVVASTQDYLINDWCQRPLSMWLEGQFAHQIRFRRPSNADYDGSRNSILQPYAMGPYTATLLPRTTTALLSNIAGATTGITGAEAALTALIGSGNSVLTSAVVGRMLKFGGESADYLITAQDGTRTVTLDKPIVSRMRGLGTSNVGAGYAAATARWEIGPPGRFKIRFLPTPGATATVYVRYMAYPRKLVGLSDTPELQEDMHHLIWKGAMRLIGANKQNQAMYDMCANEYATALKMLQKSDCDDEASADEPKYATMEDRFVAVPRGTYIRNRGSYH